MDGFESDIFTFRRDSAAAAIVDDTVLSEGFRDEALLETMTDDEVKHIFAILVGYDYTIFN
jgi:hypothetical protein